MIDCAAMTNGEFELIDNVRQQIRGKGVASGRLAIGIGDDAACFRPREGYDLLVTCDAMVEGQHYLPGLVTPFEVGRRAMAANISDIGAMGGQPLYALVSLGLSSPAVHTDIEALYDGFLAELNPMGGAIAGGNITRLNGANFVDITLIGEVEAGKAVRRNSARPGDLVLVTGYPGQAAAGLQLFKKFGANTRQDFPELAAAYVTPRHRAKEACAIAQLRCVSSMIDVSDGLTADLFHICQESGVGSTLVLDRLPVSDQLRQATRLLEKTPVDFILGASDDYELIVTCAPSDVDRIQSCASKVSGVLLHEIGRITHAGEGLQLELKGGGRQNLCPLGWDHLRS